MGRYYRGQIVTTYIDDGLGHTKDRPALILSSDGECQWSPSLFVLAITKGIQDPCPHFHIPVHDSYATDSVTGLSFPCVAKCNWVREVEFRRVIRGLGCMPDALLMTIIAKFDEIQADPDFDDWQ